MWLLIDMHWNSCHLILVVRLAINHNRTCISFKSGIEAIPWLHTIIIITVFIEFEYDTQNIHVHDNNTKTKSRKALVMLLNTYFLCRHCSLSLQNHIMPLYFSLKWFISINVLIRPFKSNTMHNLSPCPQHRDRLHSKHLNCFRSSNKIPYVFKVDKNKLRMGCWNKKITHSSDAIWWQRPRTTLDRIMVWYLTVQSQYTNRVLTIHHHLWVFYSIQLRMISQRCTTYQPIKLIWK